MDLDDNHYPSDKRRRPSVPLIPSERTKSETADRSHTLLASLLNMISQDNVAAWINKLSSFHTRHSKSKYINEVALWIKSLLESFGFTSVYFHEFMESGYELKNVICDKRGRSNKLIIICAHYDSIMEDINNADERAPGANDNASGVSIVLEIARVISQVSLEDSIQFVFFSGEEQGLWGSKKYAEYIKQNNVNLQRLINLDMVGNPPSNQEKVIIERDLGNHVSLNDQESQNFGQFIEQMAVNYTNLQVMLGPIYDSDYMPFEAQGYVVVGIYDGGEANPSYHSKTDIPSTINLKYTVSVAKVVLATIVNEARLQGS